MRKIFAPCAIYYIGTAREIRSLYRKMKGKTKYSVVRKSPLKVTDGRYYAIKVDFGRTGLETGRFSVLGETQICHILMGDMV